MNYKSGTILIDSDGDYMKVIDEDRFVWLTFRKDPYHPHVLDTQPMFFSTLPNRLQYRPVSKLEQALK